MISVKRLVDPSGKQFYLVESRLPDGKLQCITRSFKFRCNARGFEDGDARGKALRFAITTDTLSPFRAFIFSELDVSSGAGRVEGSVPSVPSRLDPLSPLGCSQETLKRRIRSYVCMRQNRLTGLRFVIAMSRLESGRLRAVSFQDHSLAGSAISDEALNKAVRFLRGVAFESWRKQAMSELTSRDREAVGHRRERALKHGSAFVEIEAGEKVDCACGKNRSRGLMVACERCGAWEHAECQGFRSDKQIPADYICSACMRAEREDVVVIRLEEQGECGNLQLEDLWTDSKIRDSEADDVCCVCGCEDNQEFENMTHPVNEHLCDGGAALAHPSCISGAQHLAHKAWTGKAVAAGMCQLCGDRFVKSPKGSEEMYSMTSSGVTQSKPLKGSTSPNQSHMRNSRRSVKVDQSGRGAKRLRSALVNGGVVTKQEVSDKRPVKSVKEEESDAHASQSGVKMDTTSWEANKRPSETVLGGRFNDPAVTVPIKKRRLQMAEIFRSPSPPPRSPSPAPQIDILVPKGELVDQPDFKDNDEAVQGSEDAEMVEVGLLEDVAAIGGAGNREAIIEQRKGESGQLPEDIKPFQSEKVSKSTVARSSDPDVIGVSSNVVYTKNRVSVSAPHVSNVQGSHTPDPDCRSDVLADGEKQDSIKAEDENLSGKLVQHEDVNLLADAENKDAAASSSASQGRSRDVRLHWDLNMDMEEWGSPPEEDTGTFSGVRLGSDHVVHVLESNYASSMDGEVRPVVEVLQRVSNDREAIIEDPHVEGECDVSSSDAGSTGSKCRMETGEPNCAVKVSSFEDESELQSVQLQESPTTKESDIVEADASAVLSCRIDVEINSSAILECLPESSVYPYQRSETDDGQNLERDAEGEEDTEEGKEVADVKAKNTAIEDDMDAELALGSESRDAVRNRVGDGAHDEGQCSPSASFVELGEKSLSDAEFSGTSDLTKSKMEAEDGNTGAESSVEVNNDNHAVSADNYDFVEYDASDEEDERTTEIERALPDKSDEKLQSIDSQRLGSPREWNEGPVEELEAEHVDYDDSDSRDGEDVGSEAGDKMESERRDDGEPGAPEHLSRAHEFGSNVAFKTGPSDGGTGAGRSVSKLSGDTKEVVEVTAMESGDKPQFVGSKSVSTQDVDLEFRDSLDVAEMRRQEENGRLSGEGPDRELNEKVEIVVKIDDKRIQDDKEASTSGSSARRVDGQSTRRVDGQLRTKSSGWDQLPEGFEKAEDALRAAKENPAVRSGRGSPWGSANGRGSNISPRGGPVASRFGRGLRTEGVGDRARSEDSWSRDDHQRVQRVDENVDISPRLTSPRELGRGRSHGRGGSPVVRVRGRMEPWMDSPGGPTSPWGPNRHPSPPGRYGDGGFGPRGPTNAAAMAAAKVESSGFVVAPDGTVTKAGSSARGPPRPFQSGGRNGRGVMFNIGRGGPGMNIGVGMNLGGLRVSMGMGRGMGMGPGMGMNMNMGMGMGVGPGLGLGMAGREVPGGRGVVDRYSGPYSGRGLGGGPGVENSSSRRGRSHEDYSETWSRREDRSASPRKRRSTSRRSRSLTPSRSKSRTRSPKAKTPPRPANSSGSAGGVAGKSNKKRSHSPAAHKPEARGERAESPAHRSVPPPPKLPLPPPPPRSQRSPPAGLKRLGESKKDGDRARSRDRERERERERERPTMRARTPPRRTSPHVVHGSALMDERDRQLLAGIRHVSPVTTRNRSSDTPGSGAVASTRDSPLLASPVGRVGEGTSDSRRHSGDDGAENRVHGGPKRDDTGSKGEQRSSKETSKGDRERNSRRESGRDRDEERRDVSKSSYSSRDRDGRSSSSLKYNREGDDDVAPRRRRPSP